MTVVDVNTGKFVGSGGNLEETVTKNNLEAAEEIVRQLRLRDIGGIIVVDFIDMVLETNRDLVLRRLVECLSRDRTKHQVAEVTSLGLVQMTRKKLGLGLVESFSENCEVCAGRGIIVHHDPVFKHRAPAAEIGDRGGDGSTARPRRAGAADAAVGGGSGAPLRRTAHGSTGTHAITEDVRNALAQIAKSTVPHTDTRTPSTARCRMPTRAASSKVEQAAGAAAEAAVEILDIPVAKASRSSAHDQHAGCRADPRLGARGSSRAEAAGQGRGRALAPCRQRRCRRHPAEAPSSRRGERVQSPRWARSFFCACVTRSPAACSRRSSSRPVTGSAPRAIDRRPGARAARRSGHCRSRARGCPRAARRLQLIQRSIADEVSPDGAVGRPHGLVDQHGHGA